MENKHYIKIPIPYMEFIYNEWIENFPCDEHKNNRDQEKETDEQ